MSAVWQALERFRREPSPHNGRTNNPFRLSSTISGPASPGEVEAAWRGLVLPADVVDLWAACRGARLFEDIDYGQWGLVILDPATSAARTAQDRELRPSEFMHDDIVLGEFLGDQELVVVAPSEGGDRRVMIALPLDSRSEWIGAAHNLGDFLEAYFVAAGDKYWEQRRSSM